MNYLNKKIYVGIFSILSIAIYLIAIWFFSASEESFLNHFKAISVAVSFDGVFIWLFTKYIWKWKRLYNWLVPFPDLNGTWKGEIKSNYIDKNTQAKIGEISATLTIQQSFVYTHCLLKTATMESSSFVSQFDINKEKQQLKLVYSYGGEANLLLKDKNPTHFGTTMLNIEANGEVLRGSYWTDRKTTGELTFRKLQDD